MVGSDTDGGVAKYMVVGKRRGREKFGAETAREGENWKRPDGYWRAGGVRDGGGRAACGLLGSGARVCSRIAKSQFQKGHFVFRTFGSGSAVL